jgi:fatty acid desaturase
MQSQTLAAKTALTTLSRNSKEEIRWLLAQDMIYLSLVYIHFGICLAGYLPMWTFCVGAPMYVSRWMIGLHETLHLVKLEDTPLLIRLHLLIVTPISLGYKEIRDIHMRHHAYTLTERDPDLYHIHASFIGGFIKATFSPEISAYHWIREKGVDRQLGIGMAIRFTLFVMLAGSLGWSSLWYFIPVRLAYGTCMFSISHFLHHDGGLYGTFPPKFNRLLGGFISVYFGRAAMQTLCYHDIHHDYPKIAAFKLPEARIYYTPRSTSLVGQPQPRVPITQ